jgi:hypothetical protein
MWLPGDDNWEWSDVLATFLVGLAKALIVLLRK